MRYVTAFLLPRVSQIGPAWFRRWVVNIFPWKTAHDVRDIIDVLHNTSVEIFESKMAALAQGDKALADQIGQGKDIMSILSTPWLLSLSFCPLPELTDMCSESKYVCLSRGKLVPR